MASTNSNLLTYRSVFPLKSISDVVNLFRLQLQNKVEPDLTLLSIVTGFIEHSLTSGKIQESGLTPSDGAETLNNFPLVTFDIVDTLYKKFQTILSVLEKPKSVKNANRQAIKKVSDIIWHSLIRSSYKDKAHLQNLYSYLSCSKLDCFGVAFAVVAGCQLLGYKDVHLSISEDHAWVVFGKNRSETIEVTWHGRGHEDKRGQSAIGGCGSQSWLYLAGHPVVCDRFMEVAAIVSAINISLTPVSDCLELADLQQNLLWLLYDMGHLQKYPMGLGNLGELEEVSQSLNRPSCEELYKEAIKSAQENYKNHHVYPYTYQGGFYYRQNKYREAFASWANAGDVIRLYNYSRDDEEIYKEFLEIANELIPHVMKSESSGHSAKSILRDSECFANLLRFYDGICQWEEGSTTPILHIGWAKPLVNTISKFDYDIRSQIIINIPDNETKVDNNLQSTTIEGIVKPDGSEGNNNCIKKNEKAFTSDAEVNKKSDIPTLADLTAACGEKILNPDFLLQGDGQPFTDRKVKESEDLLSREESLYSNILTTYESTNYTDKVNSKSKNLNMEDTNPISVAAAAETSVGSTNLTSTSVSEVSDCFENFNYKLKRPCITLYSKKMKGLKDLLLAEKLNTHAISLQVTAQSNVTSGRKLRGCSGGDKVVLGLSGNSTSVTETETNIGTSRSKRIRKD